MSGRSELFGGSSITLKKLSRLAMTWWAGPPEPEPRETACWSLKMSTENRLLTLSEDVGGALQLEEEEERHKLCSRSVPKGGARDWPATYRRGSRRFSPGGVVRFCAGSPFTCEATLA